MKATSLGWLQLPHGLPRLVLAVGAVVLLSGLAPILPMPNATPTSMAHPSPSKPPTKVKGAAKPKKPGGAKPAKPGSAKPKHPGAAKPKRGTLTILPPEPKAGWRYTPKPFLTAKPQPSQPAWPTSRPGTFPQATPMKGAFPAYTPSPANGAKNVGVPGAPTAPYRGGHSPPPTPTPPPPRAMGGPWVSVGWGGIGTTHKTLRVGESLKLRRAKGYTQPIQLLVVNPESHEAPYVTRPFNQFPGKLNHAQKMAYLGGIEHFRHLHWVIGRAVELNILPEAFNQLFEQLNSSGQEPQWPMKFLFYVVVAPRGHNQEVYYKLLVTVVR
jgi:hypothetical protein